MTTDRETVRHDSVPGVVAALAAAEPQRPAIEDGERRFTYGELDAAAAAIAGELLRAGIEPEEAVVVCLPRSFEAIASFLGVMRAGGAYVPVNPDNPPLRQRELAELAAARFALSGHPFGAGLPAGLSVLDAARLARERPAAADPPDVDPDGPAYVLFTSGSTGTPKGVEVMHRNLVHRLCADADAVPRAEDSVLQVVPLDFDVAALEIWGSLLKGARVVIAPSGRPDPQRIGRLIADRGVTFLGASVGVFAELVRAALPDLEGLRIATPGGDVLAPEAVRALRRAHPHVRIVNCYGPTEVTITATSFEVGDPDDTPFPIGRPLPGDRVYVLDEERRPVEDGADGEIWVGGPGVSRGYRGDPERTAEHFVPDPFGPGRMYRTGDRGRFREDGELLFLGRIDRQVKVAGQRVELGEIEHALSRHPAVDAAAVVAPEPVPGHKRLVAHVAPASGAGPTDAELRVFLGERLPRYMVPAAFVTHRALPLTERGKVDRTALLRAGERGPSGAASESGGTAAAVCELMAELLGLDSVGPDESLFDLGGDSLLAIGLLGLVRERFGVDLGIDAVFDSPTAASLADRIELAPGGERPRLAPGSRQATAPLSYAQRRGWLFTRMHPESIAYQFAALFRFRGALDPEALAGALEDLVARHEILRTAFVERGGEAVQEIRDRVTVPLEELDLRGQSPGAVARVIRARVRTAIDTARPPLARWTLLRLGEEEWGLVHVEHHLIHDGWSFTVLVDELSALYSARAEGRPRELPVPVIQFRDYALWERELGTSELMDEQIAYWKRRLDPDAPPIELPADRPRGPRETFKGSSIRRRMEPADAEALAAAGRAEGATLFMASFAALAALLARYSGRDDLQIGSGVANRTEPATRRLIGMVVNTIVLRVDLAGDPSVAELLRRVRRTALEAYANADAPIDRVVDAVGPSRDPSRSPLFNVLYSFHDSPRGPERWAGLETDMVQTLPNGTAKADLNIIGIADPDGGMTFIWEHSDLLEDATVDRIASHHLELMRGFASRPEARVAELPIGGGDEVRRGRGAISADHVLRGPASAYERESSIVGVFRDRAAESPGAVALDLEGARLGYAELDARSDSIARRLASAGVEPGDRVGVLMRRSLDCYAALLGVLKAGAAYVALDPDWPPARVAAIAGDAGLRVALSEEGLAGRLPDVVTALEPGAPDGAHEGELPPPPGPEDVAYVAYTSGSTGSPKGVEVPHRAVVRLARGQDWVRLDPGQTLLAAAPIAFDASTFEIWGALLNGARLAIFPPEPVTPDALDEVVRRQRVTTLWLTAGLFHRFVDLDLDTLRVIRQLLAGGDVLSPEHVRRALERMPPDSVLINGYGPTEATTFTSTHPMRDAGSLGGAAIPIGRPLANTHVVVVDDAGRSVPPGVTGELWIGGDGVAKGYLGDPTLTAERFVPDPLSGGRWYRSGDEARVRADGAIEFHGRRDRQLKIRGHRVEPAEVERALAEHPGVAEVAVEAGRDPDGQARLDAYYVSRGGGAADWRELRAWVSGRLPGAFVPSAWHELAELPLNANGKVDRAALPALAARASAPAAGRRRSRIRDSLEDRLCEIWAAVLGLEAVGPDDDFFELGGHSLLAVSLFTEIERRLGAELPLATLFEAPTPAALAARIRQGGWREHWEPLVALRESGGRPPFLCVTAGDGNAVGFGALARRLDDDQPFYALQPPGMDGRSRFPATVEAMAERYLREIRAVAPSGPYLLGGRCLGTKVALEMAQRLLAGGEEVALLAVLDDLEGPAAMDATLPNGVPYGDVLSRLRERADREGVAIGDVNRREGAEALVAYAREPVAGGVPRLLQEVWLERPEVREAFPDIENRDGPGLIDWAWLYGRDLLELPEQLLPPPSSPRIARPRRRIRMPAPGRGGLAEWVDVAARGRLPGARERRRARLSRITRTANAAYRARPYPGRITHLASAERAQELSARRWHDIARGGVEEHVLSASHRSMLRAPGVEELAATLDDCIGRALR